MARKTVIRRLFKYLPVSIEIQRAVGLDEQAEEGIAQQNDAIFDVTAETDVQDAPKQPEAKTVHRVKAARATDDVQKCAEKKQEEPEVKAEQGAFAAFQPDPLPKSAPVTRDSIIEQIALLAKDLGEPMEHVGTVRVEKLFGASPADKLTIEQLGQLIDSMKADLAKKARK
jgi:hypothetical protein